MQFLTRPIIATKRKYLNIYSTFITVGEIVDHYFHVGISSGKQFIPVYSSYINHLKDSLHNIPLAEVTINLLTKCKIDLLHSINKKNATKYLAGSTINKIFEFVRAATNYAIATGLYKGKNPFSFVRSLWSSVQVNNKRLRFLTKDEAKILLEYLLVHDSQSHDLVLLALRTGLRPTEIFRLKAQDIDPSANVINIIAKGGKRIAIKIDRDLIKMLLSYQRLPSETIFQTKSKGKLNKTPEAFKIAVEKLGLQSDDPLYRVTLHTMRHTFASWLAQSGQVSIMELQKLMRHQNITMTMRYAHLFPGMESEKLAIVRKILTN